MGSKKHLSRRVRTVRTRANQAGAATAAIAAYCHARRYPEPVPEYRFAPPRRWRFDLAWPAQKLALEIEGVLYGSGGRHQRVAGYEADCEKYSTAALAGWTTLRCTYRQIQTGLVYNWLDQFFANPPLAHECLAG